MSPAPDPGGQFASDSHRRVCGSLGQRSAEGYGLDTLLERVQADPHTEINDLDALSAILADLSSDGLATEGVNGWYTTRAGYALLTGPNAGDEG